MLRTRLLPALLLPVALLIGLTTTRAQTGSLAINTDGSTADASALLDVKSTTQGVLVPRMTAAQRTTISNAATGLLVYQTDAPAGFWFYNGTAWTSLSGGGTGTNVYTADGSLTANRTITMNGKTLDFGGTGNLGLNTNALRLKSSGDGNHFLAYDNTTDGPILAGNLGGKLNYGGNGANTALSWSSSGVGINGGSNAFTLPTGRGTSNQVLTTDGSGSTSWSTPSAGGSSGPSLQLFAVKTSAQNLAPGSLTNVPDAVVFSTTNGTGASLTNGNTWNGSTFTVGSTGAGLYTFEVRLTGGFQAAAPMLDINSTGYSATSIYGDFLNQTGYTANFFNRRGSLNTTLYLTAGTTVTIRGNSAGTSFPSDLNGDATCRVVVVKLN